MSIHGCMSMPCAVCAGSVALTPVDIAMLAMAARRGAIIIEGRFADDEELDDA